MNILQILPELKLGGVEKTTVELARWLTQQGYKAVVISGGGRLVDYLKDAEVRHYELPVGRKSIFTMLSLIGKVKEIILKEQIDIVHVRSRVPAFIAFFATRKTNAVFITTAHGYYRRHFFSRVMGWGKYVIVASNVIARHMMEGFGVPFDRLRLIPRGVNLGDYHFKDTAVRQKLDYKIGLIGRITPIKGHTYFLKAVALVWRKMPNIKVVVVGEPSRGKERFKEELIVLARRLGISEVVDFLGYSDNIPALLQELDVLCVPSIVPEGFGRVVIEAQASGVPVVGTRVGGIVEIIEDEKTGLLVYPQDSNSLAQAISRLLKDRELAKQISLNARQKVEKDFSVDKMFSLTLDVYKESIRTTRILVIKMSALGDCILAIPSIRAIRQKFPNGYIKVLIDMRFRNVLKGCPYINDTIVCDFERRHKGLRGFLRLAKELRRENFDVIVDLQNSRKSHILSFLSMCPLRFGYDNGKFSFLLNRKVKDSGPVLRPIAHQSRVLNLLGINSKDERLELWYTKEDEQWADDFLNQNWVAQGQRLVGINLAASERWATKRWPPNYIAKLTEVLAIQMGIRTVFTGLKKDMGLAKKIVSVTKSKPIIACGRTNLSRLCALMKRCAVYITPDSAPMHIASALGVPFVALFGPTDPSRHLNPASAYVVLKKNLKCAPCYKSRCFIGYKCMKKIGVDEVADAVRTLLKI